MSKTERSVLLGKIFLSLNEYNRTFCFTRLINSFAQMSKTERSVLLGKIFLSLKSKTERSVLFG
jgi:hypothetical protein